LFDKGKRAWGKAGKNDDKTKQRKLEEAKEDYESLRKGQQVVTMFNNEGKEGIQRLVHSAENLEEVTSSNEFKSVINPENFDLTIFRNPKVASEAQGRYKLILNRMYESFNIMLDDTERLIKLGKDSKDKYSKNLKIVNAAKVFDNSLVEIKKKLKKLQNTVIQAHNHSKKPKAKITTDTKLLSEINELVKYILGKAHNEPVIELYKNLDKLLLNVAKETSETVENESKETEEGKSPEGKKFSNEQLFKMINTLEKDVDKLRNKYELNKSDFKSKKGYHDSLMSLINLLKHLLENNSSANPKNPENKLVNLEKGNMYIEKLNQYVQEYNSVFTENKSGVPSQSEGTTLFKKFLVEIFTKNPKLANKNQYYSVLKIVATAADKYFGNKISTGKGLEGRISEAFGINIKPTETNGINDIFLKVVAEFKSGKA